MFVKADCESITSSPGTPGGGASLRRTLDGRRQLVLELFQDQGLFPSNQVHRDQANNA